MWDHEEKATLRELLHALIALIRDVQKALKKYLAETLSGTTLKGNLMANYQLNTADSVIITLTDTDNVTGSVVAIDAGSITATLSPANDTVVVNADGTVTITGSATLGTSNTVTVQASVNGVASTPWVGTYDVVAAVVPADATTLSGVFGTESTPTLPGTTPGTVGGVPSGTPIPAGAQAVTGAGLAPASILLASGRTIQAGTPLPAGTTYVAATNELVNTDGTAYLG